LLTVLSVGLINRSRYSIARRCTVNRITLIEALTIIIASRYYFFVGPADEGGRRDRASLSTFFRILITLRSSKQRARGAA